MQTAPENTLHFMLEHLRADIKIAMYPIGFDEITKSGVIMNLHDFALDVISQIISHLLIILSIIIY